MKLPVLTITLFTFLFVSCEGPAGPQGPQGEQGIAGEDGADGSANVTSFVVSYSTSDVECNPGNFVCWVEFKRDEITANVADNGSVNAYLDYGITWTALPLNNLFKDVEIGYSYSENYVFIEFLSSDDTAITEDEYPVEEVKFVIIPPASS